MGSVRRYQKRKAAARASASPSAGDTAAPALKRKKNEPIVSDSDSDEAKIQKLEKAGALEEGKILKLKKEFVAANQASVAKIPLFFTEPTPPEEEETAAASQLQPADEMIKKRRKTKKVLVKRVVPRCVIESYKARLFTIIPDECILTDDELAKHSQDFQKSYAENMDLMNKMRAWQKALLEQYDKFGYAVDESEAEVTDDDDEDDEPAAEAPCELQTPPTCPIQCTVDSPKVHTEHSYPSSFEPVDPTVDAGPPNSPPVDTHPTEDNDDFIKKVARKKDSPLIREPPKQPPANAELMMPRRSKRLATQSLSRVPVSKRGEVLIMQRMDYTKGSSAPSASEMEAFDRLFDGNLSTSEVEVMDELDPAVRKSSSNQPQRQAAS